MKLTTAQITDIILNNPNKDLVAKGQAKSKLLRKHMYGDMLAQNIAKIDGLEAEMYYTLRKKYCTSNKDLFARLGRPVDQVFSANGGSMYFNLSDSLNKKASIAAAYVRDGLPLRKWVENYWKPHYLDDPCGMLLMEIGNGGQYEKGRVYPTYKSIASVYDYKPKGTMLEHVSFKLSDAEVSAIGITEQGTYFRLIDDYSDYIIRSKNKAVTILNEFTVPNYFKFVPAMINSDIIDPNCDNSFLSLFDPAMELAEDYLLTGGVRKVIKLRHGFPKYWEYGSICPTCDGAGIDDGKSCNTCKGAGKIGVTKPDQIKLLATPASKEDPVIAPNPFGYLEPSETYHKISTEDLSNLENAMYQTIWGTDNDNKTQGMSTSDKGTKTATEIISDTKPIANTLNPISDSGEIRMRFIMDCIIRVQLAVASYPGSSISLGRRYLLESEDALWERYSEARLGGASQNVLNELLNEYYEKKYSSDPVGLLIAQKLMYVEPFVHLTISQVQTLGVSEDEYKTKLYFGEWLATLNDSMLIDWDAEQMKAQLAQFANTKELAPPKPIGA